LDTEIGLDMTRPIRQFAMLHTNTTSVFVLLGQ